MPAQTARKGKRGRAALLRRTRLCASFRDNGTCGYGNECVFAHGSSQLRCRPVQVVGPRASIWNPSTSMRGNMFSRMCDKIVRGKTCYHGDACFFAHDKKELSMTVEDVVESRIQSSRSNDEGSGDSEPVYEQVSENVVALDQTLVQEETKGLLIHNGMQQIAQHANVTKNRIRTSNGTVRKVCSGKHRVQFQRQTHRFASRPASRSRSLVPNPMLSSVWSRSCVQYPGHYWGPVFLPVLGDNAGSFDALKPDTSTVPNVHVPVQDRFRYLHTQCFSLYNYIAAHHTGIRASVLLPKLRYAFPELANCTDTFVLTCLTDCADVWCDQTRVKYGVFVHVT